MVLKSVVAVFFLLFFKGAGHASSIEHNVFLKDSVLFIEWQEQCRPNPIRSLLRKKITEPGHRVVAAILAFPFPFGIVGLHRIYLGTAPYVPVVYIATLGGVFGILPLIDFCVLLLDKNTDKYISNKQVFMWMN
jgi:TM2 domain-containing membrane protein YozV